MNFEIHYKPSVIKSDIPKLDKIIKEKIKRDIEKKLSEYPEVFGKPLRNSLQGLRSLRSGNYRILFEIEKKQVTILMIEHRSHVYKKAIERLKDNFNR